MSRNLLQIFKRTNKPQEVSIKPTDLSIPIYLNQQVVFDLLAILDDGFSRLSAIKTSAGETETNKYGMGSSIGVSNVFALLGVSFSGDRAKEKGLHKQTEISQEKVHTPTSLFAKLHLVLQEKHFIKKIESESMLTDLHSGDFVEFKAILRKNPLVDTIEGFKTIIEMAALFTGESIVPSNQKQKRPQNQMTLVTQQMDGMLNALTQSNSVELIGELLDALGVKAVITSRIDFFSQGNTSEIIDGEFQVLGKITRVIQPNSDESINLLRKTPFGRLNQTLLKKFSDIMSSTESMGLRNPEFIAEIDGPALLVVPIAIYT